jgi:nucleoside-triphosphatase THEP1
MTDKDAAYVISPHTFFINGITGAGKTSAVSRIVGRLNSDKVLYITAANEG